MKETKKPTGEADKIKQLKKAVEEYFGGECVSFAIETDLKIKGLEKPIYKKVEFGGEEETCRIGFIQEQQ